MHEMIRTNPEPTLLPTEEIFNLPHHIGMLREELAFDAAVSYGSDRGIHTPVPQHFNQLSYLHTPFSATKTNDKKKDGEVEWMQFLGS